MAAEVILIDTSILIDFYRKKDKSASAFFKLFSQDTIFAVSVITHFEIIVGTRGNQFSFWNNLFHDLTILPFGTEASVFAAQIDSDLRKRRKRIDIPDLFIAATAIVNDLPPATLNKKHFERIPNLRLID